MTDDTSQGLDLIRDLAARMGLTDQVSVQSADAYADADPDGSDVDDPDADTDPSDDGDADADGDQGDGDDPDDPDADGDADADADGDVDAADADPAPFDGVDLSASATGSIQYDATDVDLPADIQAADEDTDAALVGIVWGAGDHDLSLGGEPTPVRVPADTVPPTFQALQEDVEAGDVGIGTDHPDGDSVAAKTGTVNIGQADDVALSADERYIVMTDSTLTSEAAEEAAERGDFDDLDFSIVGDVAVARDDEGQPVTEDGRIVLDAVRITRIDVVNTGAVDAASIGTIPDLKDQAEAVRQAVDANKPSAAADALRASASAIASYQEDMNDPDINLNPDDLDTARDQLSAAASVIDDQKEELTAARAKAGAFEDLLSAHDVDADEFDGPEAAAQAVIDQQTADVREDIAQVEADLPKYDTDDVEARAEDLAGKSPRELQNILNARKAEAYDAQQAQAQKGAAAAKGDQQGQASFSGGDGSADTDADDVALQAMDGADRIQAKQKGQSPAEFVEDEYGLNAGQYDHADELQNDILDAIGGDA